MSKKFLHLLIFSMSTSSVIICPDSAQSSYCSRLENECEKKCNEEKLKCVEEAQIKGIGAEKEVVKKILCSIDNLEIQLGECYESCANARRQCNKEHPLSECQDRIAKLESQQSELVVKLNYLERKIHSLEPKSEQ